jgi:Zn finger protein HypA/HybF involved in hydrogenase expression
MIEVKALQKAPVEANFQCAQCGQVLALKQGQLIPPCPKCAGKTFRQTDLAVNC